MQFINFRLNLLLCLVGFSVAFLKFDDNKEYEFSFKSKFVLAPAHMGDGQNVTATILVKKLGTDGLVFRIKDATFVGANIRSKSRSDIEGIFGVKLEDGSITRVMSKSQRKMEILYKKTIADLLSEDLSFFETYAANYDTMSRHVHHNVKLAIGSCNARVMAVADIQKNLLQVLAQAEKKDCDIDPVILMADQLLMQGTTIGQTENDSKFGTSVIFDTNTKRMVEVSKFMFINSVVAIFDVQARHNVIVQFVAERPISHELDFAPPYISYAKKDIDHFVREYH